MNAGGSRFVVTPVPLTLGKMMIEYVAGSDLKLRDRVYYAENRSLSSEEIPNGMTLGNVYGYSSVAQGDDVYVVINVATTYNLAEYKRAYAAGTWSFLTTLQTSTTSRTDPVISIDTTNNLYVLWAGSPAANHIYYRRFLASNATWMGRVDWLTETGLPSNDGLTSFYQGSNYIGVAYMNATSNPYQIRFAYLVSTKQ
jgi:hypothetical protein